MVTQPRRIAAITVAKRVAEELGEKVPFFFFLVVAGGGGLVGQYYLWERKMVVSYKCFLNLIVA